MRARQNYLLQQYGQRNDTAKQVLADIKEAMVVSSIASHYLLLCITLGRVPRTRKFAQLRTQSLKILSFKSLGELRVQPFMLQLLPKFLAFYFSAFPVHLKKSERVHCRRSERKKKSKTTQKVKKNAFSLDKTRQDANFRGNPLFQSFSCPIPSARIQLAKDKCVVLFRFLVVVVVFNIFIIIVRSCEKEDFLEN